jgi:hypothetical protein
MQRLCVTARERLLFLIVCSGLCAATSAARAGNSPWATAAFDYAPGSLVDASYQNPAVLLGSPERFTGEGVFPGAVTPFNPAFGTDELLSLGRGGSVTVRFDQPVLDDPANPFGIDLLIFGNAGFIDTDFPNGLIGGVFSAGGGIVEVSSNGSTWVTVTSAVADGLFPTLGYLDLAGPFDTNPGLLPADFTKPVNPALNPLGLTFAQLITAYDGSGGGTGIDLAFTGLAAISFVRVSNPITATQNLQLDAFSDVTPIPAPAGVALFGIVLMGARSRRRR